MKVDVVVRFLCFLFNKWGSFNFNVILLLFFFFTKLYCYCCNFVGNLSEKHTKKKKIKKKKNYEKKKKLKIHTIFKRKTNQI